MKKRLLMFFVIFLMFFWSFNVNAEEVQEDILSSQLNQTGNNVELKTSDEISSFNDETKLANDTNDNNVESIKEQNKDLVSVDEDKSVNNSNDNINKESNTEKNKIEENEESKQDNNVNNDNINNEINTEENKIDENEESKQDNNVNNDTPKSVSTNPVIKASSNDPLHDNDNAPTHTKEISDNGNGTYELSLNVTGSAQTPLIPAEANVLVIYDSSSSMTHWWAVSENGSYGNDVFDPAYTDYNGYYKLFKRGQYSEITDENFDGQSYKLVDGKYVLIGEEEEYSGTRYMFVDGNSSDDIYYELYELVSNTKDST